jgi:hypothetical protein
MQKPMMIYLIALIFGIYSLFTIKYSFANGAIVPVIIAIIPLIGSIGLFIRKAWARYFIYTFTIISICWWMIHTIWLISHKGWPYYPSPGQSIIELFADIFLYLFFIISSWIVWMYFKMKDERYL